MLTPLAEMVKKRHKCKQLSTDLYLHVHGEHADQGFLDNQQFLMVLGMTVDKSYAPFVVGLK